MTHIENLPKLPLDYCGESSSLLGAFERYTYDYSIWYRRYTNLLGELPPDIPTPLSAPESRQVLLSQTFSQQAIYRHFFHTISSQLNPSSHLPVYFDLGCADGYRALGLASTPELYVGFDKLSFSETNLDRLLIYLFHYVADSDLSTFSKTAIAELYSRSHLFFDHDLAEAQTWTDAIHPLLANCDPYQPIFTICNPDINQPSANWPQVFTYAVSTSQERQIPMVISTSNLASLQRIFDHLSPILNITSPSIDISADHSFTPLSLHAPSWFIQAFSHPGNLWPIEESYSDLPRQQDSLLILLVPRL